jgi:hypothetical protein
VEQIIRALLPEDSDRGHRVCLLRIVHAAERTQLLLDELGLTLAEHLHDFSHVYSGSFAKDAAESLAGQLERLAQEIRKSLPDMCRYARNRFYANLPEDQKEIARGLNVLP